MSDALSGMTDLLGLLPVRASVSTGSVLLAVMLLVVCTLAAVGMRCTTQACRRARAGHDLGVAIPRGFRVSRSQRLRRTGSYHLAYPRWRYAIQDGTRDHRRSGNRVVKSWSVLEVGRWRVASKDVLAMYDLVLSLRAAGVDIAYSRHEQTKLRAIQARTQDRPRGSSLDGVIAEFANRSTGFEAFCADLFRGMGYQTELPGTRGGGFDLRLRRDGTTSIVRCACHPGDRGVGAPAVHKLHGANIVEGADSMIVVSTSSFTPDAVDFAQEAGVDLIDGDRLRAMCHRVWGAALPPSATPEGSVELSLEELLTGFPIDMRHRSI
ncbi:MAG: restriction endonuclease [Actinomyces sp.]|uniref:restriction endonuclease n=1 Tax=Actinomyces sp. TaxID=29317 RepID=UPI0026DAF78E|nr:restriction endonuclease [Actinomyces sp.]MDO4244359.1 restriction endonuclease [Actinomyces sp.]